MGVSAWQQNWCGTVAFVGITSPPGAEIFQDDPWKTPFPNGLLRWLGYPFDRAQLPDERLFHGRSRSRRVGAGGTFVHRTRISDARVAIEPTEFEINRDQADEETARPARYRLSLEAHGPDGIIPSTTATKSEVQQMARRLEKELDNSHDERHAQCRDGNDNPTSQTCQTRVHG